MTICSVITIVFIIASVAMNFYKKNTDDFKTKAFGRQLCMIVKYVIKKSLGILAIYLVIYLVMWLVELGLVRYLPHVVAVSDGVMRSIAQGIVFAILFSVLFLILLYMIIIPIDNYISAVRMVYKGRKSGLIKWIVRLEKLAVGWSAILIVVLLYGRGQSFLSIYHDVRHDRLGDIHLNGAIQTGGRAYLTKGWFDYGLWTFRSDIKYDVYNWRKIKSDGMQKSVVGMEPEGCAYIDDRLFGVVGDDKVFVESIGSFHFAAFHYNWKESVQTDGKYDYDKIYEIIQRQTNKSISWKQTAAIVGVMMDKELIGIGPDADVMFWDKRDDGSYFVRMQHGKKTEAGPFAVDTTKDAMAIGNVIFCLSENDKFSIIHFEDESNIYMQVFEEEMGKVHVFNYSIVQDGMTYVSVAAEDYIYFMTYSDNAFVVTHKYEIPTDISRIQGVYPLESMLIMDYDDNLSYREVFDKKTKLDVAYEKIVSKLGDLVIYVQDIYKSVVE